MPGFVIAVFLTLFASGTAQARTSVNQSSAIAQNPLPAIQAQKDTLVVGSEPDYPPFATGMTDATAGGFTVDLWKAVAAEVGLNYTIRVRPFHQILQEFKEGKIDVLINLAHSEERHQFADFTVPHVIVHGAIFVRKGESGIHTEGDFTGKSIIVLNADLAHDYAVSKGWGKQLVLVDTSTEGMRLLASGKHDAMLLSKLVGMQTLQVLGLTNIEALKAKAGFSQKFTFAVQEGQSELLGKLNEGLALSKSNGTYNTLYDKWFGVYEVKEVGLRDLLKYIIPVMVVFLGIAGYFFYRRQVERAEAEKKYRDLYDHAPDMFLSVEAKTATIIDCNQTLLNNTGYSKEYLIGRPVLELYHLDCADLARAAFQKFMDSKEVHGVELQVRRKDGSKIDVSLSASAVCDEHGVILHSRSALRDITERKQVDEMLRKLYIAVEQSPASVVITNLEPCIQYVNPMFTEATGYSAAEAIGQNPRILQSGQTPNEIYLELWGKLNSSQAWHGELLNKRKNGELYWEDVHIAPVKNPAGAVTHYVAVKTDITERKQAEKALQIAVVAFETQDAIMITDADGNIIRVNHAFSVITGYSPEEVLGENQDKINSWQHDHNFCIEMLQQSIHDGSWAGEILGKHKNGQLYPKWMTVTAIKNERQEITNYVSIFSDITARKQAVEAKLRESEERFRGTLEQAAVGIVHATLDGHFQQVNQKFCNIVGYARDELIQMRFQDITFPADLDENIHYLQRLLAGEISTYSIEKRYVRKDRSLVWCNLTVSLLRDANGTPRYAIGVIEDITERRQSEASVQQFGYLLQNSFNEIYLFDAYSLHFLLTSEGAEKNLGYSFDELNQLTPLDLCPSFTQESFGKMITSLSSGEQPSLSFETAFRRKNGTTYPVEMRLQFMASDFPVFMAVTQDITERNHSERQLRDLSAHLQTVREEEKASVAREIHDNLGSTLTALKMDVYWLADELSTNKEATPFLEHVESMSQLLDNAVAVTRRVITDLRPTLLDDLGLQAALEWQAEQFQKRTGIQCWVTCIDNEGCQNKMDKIQTINLFRIFQESLTNVARHSGASRVEVELQCEDEEVILAISDNGCGLPEGHTIASTSYGMLGMRERAEQLGGKIDFYGPPGGGFSVTVILPLLTC